MFLLIFSRLDLQSTLLTSVREVVIPTAHIVVLSGFHGDQKSCERSWSVIELVLHFARLCVMFAPLLTLDISRGGHLKHDVSVCQLSSTRVASVGVISFRTLEHVGFVKEKRVVVVTAAHLDDVAAVGSSPSLSIVTLSIVVVSVGTSPLEVNQICLLVNLQVHGDEIILDSGVYLHDIASLTPHIHVKDAFIVGFFRSLGEHHVVGTILEGTTELSSVDGQLEVQITNSHVDFWIVFNHRAIRAVIIVTCISSIGVEIIRANVVPDPHNTTLILFTGEIWHLPLVVH